MDITINIGNHTKKVFSNTGISPTAVGGWGKQLSNGSYAGICSLSYKRRLSNTGMIKLVEVHKAKTASIVHHTKKVLSNKQHQIISFSLKMTESFHYVVWAHTAQSKVAESSH